MTFCDTKAGDATQTHWPRHFPATGGLHIANINKEVFYATSPVLKSLASLPLAYAASSRSVAQAAAFPVTGGYRSLFPNLPAAQFDSEDLIRLANGDGGDLMGMSAAPEVLTDKNGQPLRNEQGEVILSATQETELDDEENFGIPAGYTYLGQFADHDVTFKADDDFAAKGQAG